MIFLVYFYNCLENCNLSAGIIHQRSRSSEQPSKIGNQFKIRKLETSVLVEKLSNNKPIDGPITNKAYIPLKESIYQRKNLKNAEKFVLTSQAVPPLPLKRISGEDKNLTDYPLPTSKLSNVGFFN